MNNISTTFGAISNASFDPIELNPLLWYDLRLGKGTLFLDGSGDLEATDISSSIVRINDKGSSGINAITPGGSSDFAPTIETNGLSFDGTNDVYALSSTFTLDDVFTCYLVFHRDADGWSMLSNNSDRSGFWGRDNISEYAMGAATTPRVANVSGGPSTAKMAVRYIRTGLVNIGDSTVKITGNNTPGTPSALYADPNIMTHFGYSTDTGYNQPGQFCNQILIWDRVLTSIEQTQVENWISSNFGVSLGT